MPFTFDNLVTWKHLLIKTHEIKLSVSYIKGFKAIKINQTTKICINLTRKDFTKNLNVISKQFAFRFKQNVNSE